MRVPFTFTRPGSGWVMDRSGIYVERGVDEPRYQWTLDGRSEGLLIEPQATNYALHSNNLADSSWGKQGISAELIGDPKFPFPISRLTGTAQADNRRGVWTQLNAVDPYFAEGGGVPSIRGFIIKAGTQRYIWVRMGSSSTGSDLSYTHTQIDPAFDLQTGQYLGALDEFRIEPLGDGWFFCYRIYAPNNITQYTRGLSLVFVDEDGHNVTTEGTDLYVAGAVALKGDVAYSYTPTEGTPVTRPADTLYADMSLVDGFDPTRGTLIIDTDVKEAVTALAESGITIEGVEGKGKLVLTYDEDGGEVYASGAKQYGTDIPQATTFQPVTGGIALLREMVVWPRKFSPEEAKEEATGTLTMKPWTPAYLFKNGEVGVWFDPSDMSTVFQDADGTTPGELGQPVGLILDKSQGLELGPELWRPDEKVNVGNIAGSSGAWDPQTKVLSNTTVGTNDGFPRFYFNERLVPGKYYSIVGKLGGDLTSVRGIRAGAGYTTSTPINFNETTGEFQGCAKADDHRFMIVCDGTSTFDITIESLSIREIPGHHASQPTTTARPILGREPKSGRRNLLNFPSEPAIGDWSGSSNGVTTADVSIPGFSNSLQYAATPTGSGDYRYTNQSFIEKPITVSFYVQMDDGGAPVPGNNNSTGDFSLVVSSSIRALTVEHVGGSLYRCRSAPYTPTALSIGVIKYPGQAGRGFRVSGFQIEESPTVTPYQKTTSEYDITEEGVDDVYYLAFDGVDDSLLSEEYMGRGGGVSATVAIAVETTQDHTGYAWNSSGSVSSTGLLFGNAAVSARAKYESGTPESQAQHIYRTGDGILVNVLSYGASEGFSSFANQEYDIVVGNANRDNPMRIGSREGGVYFTGKIYGLFSKKEPSSKQVSRTIYEYFSKRLPNVVGGD